MQNGDDRFSEIFLCKKKQRFQTAVEGAVHHIRTSAINFGIAGIVEVIQSGMLQEVTHDGFHCNILTQTFPPRTKAANAPDDEPDGYACLTGFV